MEKRTIKIAGAGLAGLTAAIDLAKAGFRVIVYEKASQVGGHYRENPQMLPNWFTKEDVIEELEKCGIKINWLNKIEECEINLVNQRIVIYGKNSPVGYTVLRGGLNSLEKSLASQAQSLGVEIITGSPINPEIQEKNIDIIATGISQPITVGYGRVYKGNFNPKKVKVFFNPNYTKGIGYGYLFPHSSSVATVKISRPFEEKELDLKENFEKFKKNFLADEIKEENFLYEFGTLRSFNVPKSAKQGKTLFVGEAAGFQDELFRFGMRYAIISGYLAAKSISEDLDYDLLWRKRFLNEFRRTARVRRAFADFKKQRFKGLPENSEIYIDIEKFKKIWLSDWFNFLLQIYPVYKNLIFSKYFLNTFCKVAKKFNLI